MRVVDKKLPMPAYCVAANCNNSQMTPGITRHELPRNRPAMKRKWIKFIQFKRADFLAAPHHAHLCSEHFSECTSVSAISQTPWNTACRSWHDVPVVFQNPAWQAQTDTAVSLWVSRAKYQFHLRNSSWPFCSDSPEWRSRQSIGQSISRAKYQFRLRNSSWPFCSDSPEWRSRHMVTWFGRHGDAFGTTENAFFFRAFITLRSQFHLHHREL